ncbi:MAG: glycosyltransferase [Candidatus Omnitrophica bacterium]|nr:glycosyltransferase [Candidatus Omnitrophota bacterium]
MKKRKINLLFVNYSFDVGGIEVLIKNLCQYIDKESFNITLCSFSTSNSMETEFKNMGIPLIVLAKSGGIDLTLPFKLRALCKKLEIDIMHTHNATQWLYGVFSCFGKKMPAIVHTQHTILEKEEALKKKKNKHLLLRWTMKFLSDRTAGVASIAEYITRYLIAKAKIDPNKITLIYNGTDIIKSISPKDILEKKAELGLQKNSFIIGIVARLIAKKGHKVLLDAFAQVKSKLPEAKLLIVGDGGLRLELENYCKYLGLGNDVLFLGRRNDIPEILRVLNLFVLSSYKDAEGLPVSILEAMASRVPVIATDSGGSREIVLNGKTGILIESDNVQVLTEAILKMYSEKEFVEKIITQAEGMVSSTFSLENMGRKYTELYIKCLS